MTVTFQTKNGRTLSGVVLTRGFFEVDAAESFEIAVAGRDHVTFTVLVSECEVA